MLNIELNNMGRSFKFTCLLLLLTTAFASRGFSQTKPQKEALKKREQVRRAMHARDSVMRSLSKSDTSINSLLQRIEQYNTSFDQIDNSLDNGIDTVDIGEQMPDVIRRLDKINSAAKTHKSSTIYLY
jgi:potassium efflux system protein